MGSGALATPSMPESFLEEVPDVGFHMFPVGLPKCLCYFPIIERSFFGIPKHLVCFYELLKTVLGIGRTAHVRMVLSGQPTVRPFDDILAGVPGYSHYLVIVFRFQMFNYLSRAQRLGGSAHLEY